MATLRNPPSFTDWNFNDFKVPEEGTTLDPDTTYWITVHDDIALDDDASSAGLVTFLTTDSDDLRPGSKVGWSIGNETLLKDADWGDAGTYADVMYVEIRGAENVDLAQTANNPATGAPTISGTAQVGEELTADTSTIDDADGLVTASFTYQWQRQNLTTSAETDIPGATGTTYEVTSDDRDGAVRVSVSFSDDAENSETLTSYWVLVLTPPNHPPHGSADDQRHGAGGRDADGGHLAHRRRRRLDQRELRLSVDLQ